MHLAWTRGNVTVKQACTLLTTGKKSPAYTTIGTVLSRLVERGLLRAEKQGRIFVFYPVDSKETFLESRVALIRSCLDRNFRR